MHRGFRSYLGAFVGLARVLSVLSACARANTKLKPLLPFIHTALIPRGQIDCPDSLHLVVQFAIVFSRGTPRRRRRQERVPKYAELFDGCVAPHGIQQPRRASSVPIARASVFSSSPLKLSKSNKTGSELALFRRLASCRSPWPYHCEAFGGEVPLTPKG